MTGVQTCALPISILYLYPFVYSGRTVISKEGGRYSILTVENDVLTVSAKGFETVNIKVNKQKDIDIKLNYSHD